MARGRLPTLPNSPSSAELYRLGSRCRRSGATPLQGVPAPRDVTQGRPGHVPEWRKDASRSRVAAWAAL